MTTLRQAILHREQTPISFNNMKKVWKDKIHPNFVELDSLPDDPSKEHFFKGKSSCAILCILHNSDGTPSQTSHWICLIDRGNSVDYVDYLGNTPEQLTHHLKGSPALLNFSKKVKFNQANKKLQKFSSSVNDCGCFVSFRLVHHDKTPREFVHFLTHGFLNPDLSVSMICYLDLLHD